MNRTQIEAYQVIYSSGKFWPRIGLLNSGNYFAQLNFKPNGAALPLDGVVDGQIQLYYHLEDLANILALLRQSTPLYLFYNGSGDGYENGIMTVVP